MATRPPAPAPAFSRARAAFDSGRFADAERLCHSVLAAQGNSFDALHLLAVVQMSLGKNALALVSFDRALALRNDAGAHNNRGVILRTLKRTDEALGSFDRALALRPNYAEAHNNRGSALKQLRRREEALASFQAAIAARPDYAKAHFNYAVALHETRRHEEALAHYDHALRTQPDNIEILTNRGTALHEMKRFDAALASFDRALALRANSADALNNRGATLHALKRSEEALVSYDRAIAARPDYAEAFNNRGNVLKQMKRYKEALASYDRALSLRKNYLDAINNRAATLNELGRHDEALVWLDAALPLWPGNAEINNNRGVALLALRRFDAALASFEAAVAARSDYPEALNNCGIALRELARPEEALAAYDRAIAAQPDYAEALINRAGILAFLHRLEDALATYDRAWAVAPGDSNAFGGVANCAAQLCDWPKREAVSADLARHITAEKGFVTPFTLLGYVDDPALLLQSAQHYIGAKIPVLPAPLWTGQVWRHDKIRVAYLSADYRSHAMGYLVADLFETHDRSRFDITGVSLDADDGSDIRKRIGAAFDTFHDVRGIGDRQIAELLHRRQIDIAIDLQGYTGVERPAIYAHRPVPIQASYLGYAGTMGTSFMDYIIADKIVAPFDRQPFFTEKIVHLPDCYLVNDRQRRAAPQTPTRREVGLPEHGFVFCCFNNSWKFTPVMFDIWMRLLHQVEGSVLWLLGDKEGLEANLGREAEQRGIDPARLIFSKRVPADRYLARHRLADLFLDTQPYNAHSTASDALRAGLPLLTCTGKGFQARVATSLLLAIGAPELIVSNLEDYYALALKLAREPALLAGIRARIVSHLKTHPLYDTERFTRGIEDAYRTMWEIWQRGEPPRSFAVAPVESQSFGGNPAGPSSVEASP